jgi:periplasmic protein CpxP/Spy
MRNKFCTFALTGLLTLGMAGSAALAQDNSAPPQQDNQNMHGHRGMDPDMQLKHMTKQLDLSADQQSQIKPILESRQQQMQTLWQDQSLSREDRHTKMQSIQQDTSSKIEAVLNDTQKQKFEADQARMRERRMDHQQGNQAPPDSAPPQPQQ